MLISKGYNNVESVTGIEYTFSDTLNLDHFDN
jgi:hypothetical protein